MTALLESNFLSISLFSFFIYLIGIFSHLAPVVDFLNGAVVIVNKVLLTKKAPENELGKF
jgi:hypothetical protein